MGDKAKNSVSFINDPATTFAMAKNTVEGDVLVAAPRKTQFVEDFMKYYTFHKPLFGKMDIVFYITLGLALVSEHNIHSQRLSDG